MNDQNWETETLLYIVYGMYIEYKNEILKIVIASTVESTFIVEVYIKYLFIWSPGTLQTAYKEMNRDVLYIYIYMTRLSINTFTRIYATEKKI